MHWPSASRLRRRIPPVILSEDAERQSASESTDLAFVSVLLRERSPLHPPPRLCHPERERGESPPFGRRTHAFHRYEPHLLSSGGRNTIPGPSRRTFWSANRPRNKLVSRNHVAQRLFCGLGDPNPRRLLTDRFQKAIRRITEKSGGAGGSGRPGGSSGAGRPGGPGRSGESGKSGGFAR